ncbi:uncharacterized protein BDW70DRAFT_156969 [Aspergillus foveolatus]|uniref:uncharacterized protein n=1 Tax=Aspergillus foveolatus TaxID=210207 RepID=UPI003CCD20A4
MPPTESRRRSTSPSRTRSRSPTRSSNGHSRHRHHEGKDQDRGRDRDRERRLRHRHRHSHSHSQSHSHRHDRDRRNEPKDRHETRVAISLPFQARELRKRDLETYEPMFAMYLDIQKGKILEDLSEDEVKGRWKSFVGKWNRGELAEGWYDPATLEKARSANAVVPGPGDSYKITGGESHQGIVPSPSGGTDELQRDDDDEEYGPMPQYGSTRGRAPGPAIPTMQDLELQKETAIEEAIATHHDARQQYRAEIRSHKSTLRHMEDEVAPRAEPGTHERRIEKRREAAASNRAFAESRRGGSPIDAAPDDELMGSGENDLEAYKAAKEREQRKKNEREIRREEILRARAAEREERVRQYREKEEATIGWLKTLAKQRFG